MAKKKGTPQTHRHSSQYLDLKQHRPTVKAALVDDPSVQIQNLKKLNSILLMEITQRRQQIESLLHVADTNLALDLENVVLLTFVETQTREMGFRFDEVVRERNERGYEVGVLKGELKCLEDEKDQLKDELVAGAKRLMETENREGMVRDEVETLRLEGERLLEQRWQRERVIGQLKEEKEWVMKEKNEIEKLNNSQVLKISGLENELKQLDESLKNSRNEEALMRSKILQLEGNLGLAVEKEQEMAMEIRALMRDKKEMEGAEVVVSNERKLEEEIQLYAKELDAIKNVLKSKDEMVDDMKQQHKSLAKAHKTKSMWTLISSATTIFAAAAFAAYVARRR